MNHRPYTVICSDEGFEIKPQPHQLLEAKKRLNRRFVEYLYIGDHLRDIQAAKAANMQSLACGHSFKKDKFQITQWGADITTQTVEQLLQAIKTWCQQ